MNHSDINNMPGSTAYFVDQDGGIQSINRETNKSTYPSPVVIQGAKVVVKGMSEGDGGFFVEDTFVLHEDLAALKALLVTH